MLRAAAAGITGAALIRKGAFFLPDAWIFPSLIVAVTVAYGRRPSRKEGIVLAALGAFSLWWLVASLGWGVPRRAPLLLGTAAGFGAALVIAGSFSLTQRITAQRVLVGVGCATAVLGLVGVAFRSYPFAMPHDGLWRVAGTLTYANAAGLLLALVLPLAVSLEGLRPETRRVAVFLVVTGLLATMSRGAIFAAIVVVPMLPRRCLREAAWPALAGLVGGAACLAAAEGDGAQPLLAVVLVVLAVIAARGAPGLRSRPTAALAGCAVVAGAVLIAVHPVDASRFTNATVELRSSEWTAAADQLRDHPVIGGGPEKNLTLPDKGSFAYFAHNEYLQVGAGAGFVGLGLLALVFVSIVRATTRRTWQSEAATAALLVFAVAGLFDFTWHAPALGMVAGWIAGLAFRGET